MMENYLNILEDSLKQKIVVLDDIVACNGIQESLLKQEKFSIEEFDACVDKKDVLIQKLNKLDEGFELLYERIKEQLLADKAMYAEQIKRLQQLITRVTERGVSIQAQESRNKKMVEDYFAKERSAIRSGRQASKAAYDYYKNMNNANQVPPQFLDQKH